MIRMYHPEHGWTHAYGPLERERLEAQGWKVEQPQEAKQELNVVQMERVGRPKKVA